MKALISSCLLGEKTRYDGGDSLNPRLKQLDIDWILICPEILGGLNIPRPPAEIRAGRVITREGLDVTEAYKRGADLALKLAEEENVDFCIMKSKSPSCGKGRVYDGSFSSTLIYGNGITADLLIKNGFKVYGDQEFLYLLDKGLISL